MPNLKIVWILVNCNSESEAEKIGMALLKKRLVSCFDILEREGTWYWWPPKKKTIEHGEGALLVLETLEKNYKKVHTVVKRLHSDKLPFIGYFEIKGTSAAYQQWLKGEIK